MEAASPIVADLKVPERAIENRSGRKDLFLIQTLRRSREKVLAHRVVVLRPAGAAAGPLALELGVCVAQSEQERDLLAIKCISEDDRRDLGFAPVVRGFVVQPPIAAARAHRVGTVAGAQVDRDMVKIGDHFLRKDTMPVASKLFVCDLLDVAARKLDGVERSQRRSLEAIVTHSIPRDWCLLYVDFAT